jgi:hypothetical protein
VWEKVNPTGCHFNLQVSDFVAKFQIVEILRLNCSSEKSGIFGPAAGRKRSGIREQKAGAVSSLGLAGQHNGQCFANSR